MGFGTGRGRSLGRDISIDKKNQRRIHLSRALKEGLASLLTYKEDEPDEPEPASEPDEEEESAHEDRDKDEANNDEPFYPLDYEWSLWCDDTESVSLREFLKEHLDGQKLNNDEFMHVIEILAQDEEQIRIAIQFMVDGQLRSNLEKWVNTYDFNYQSVGFSDLSTPLPDVILERTEEAGGRYNFTVIVPIPDELLENIDEDNTQNNELIASWEAHLYNFTELLLEAEKLQDFFSADNFDDGWDKVKERLTQQSWSQKKLAEKWSDIIVTQSQVVERSKILKYLKNRISEIKKNRYLEIEFFDITVPFAQFFPTKGDIR